MSLPNPKRLQELIAWQFEVHEQGMTTRYGTYADAFWKQLLPRGMALPELHPPKKIDPHLYSRARKSSQPLQPVG